MFMKKNNKHLQAQQPYSDFLKGINSLSKLTDRTSDEYIQTNLDESEKTNRAYVGRIVNLQLHKDYHLTTSPSAFGYSVLESLDI